MKTNLKYLLIFAMTLLIGFASCGDDNGNDVPVGLPTNLKLSITQLGGFSSRDNNANTAEALFKTVEIFIYNSTTGVLEKQIQLNGTTDFTFENTGNGVYVGNASIPATTGPKNIYVGVNLPASITAQIIESGVSSEKFIANISSLINATDGFVMFSTEAMATTLVEDNTDPANKVTAQVKRLVAKVAIQANSTLSLDVSGGKLSDIEYNIRNNNTRYFALPSIDAGTVKDPNWSSQAAGIVMAADFYQPTDAEYIAINPSTITDNENLAVKYALENTSENQLKDELTYSSIRAKFVPSSLKVYTNGTDATGGFSDLVNTGNPVVTFYRLQMPNGTSIYTQDLEVAEDYATSNALSPTSVQTYTDGYCYYNLFLNPANKYDVIRNDFYKITISKINGLGNANPEDGITHEPLETPTDLEINVEVLDWNLIDVDSQLPGS